MVKWVLPLFLLPMDIDLKSRIWQVAEAIAPQLGLQVIDVVLQTHKRPPIVRIDVLNPAQHTGLDDCERMSRALEPELDAIVPYTYVLEVSSPGITRQLSSDREFLAFRGFMVNVSSNCEYEGKSQWQGQLVERNATHIVLNQKGKRLALPLEIISKVELTK